MRLGHWGQGDTPDSRAWQLLMSVLTPAEKTYLEQRDHLIITSQHGRRWEIKVDNGYTGNVHLLYPTDPRAIGYEKGSEGMRAFQFCGHPRMQCLMGTGRNLPNPDAYVAQVLSLRFNEDFYIATAVMESCPYDYQRSGYRGTNLNGWGLVPPEVLKADAKAEAKRAKAEAKPKHRLRDRFGRFASAS